MISKSLRPTVRRVCFSKSKMRPHFARKMNNGDRRIEKSREEKSREREVRSAVYCFPALDVIRGVNVE